VGTRRYYLLRDYAEPRVERAVRAFHDVAFQAEGSPEQFRFPKLTRIGAHRGSTT